MLCINQRARRHQNDTILAGSSCAVSPRTPRAVFGRKLSRVPKIGKRIEITCRPQDDISPSAPVASIRSAFWHELLTKKTQAPMAPIACLECNHGLVDEFHLRPYFVKNPAQLAGLFANRGTCVQLSVRTLTVRLFFGPLMSNFTFPSARAKSV